MLINYINMLLMCQQILRRKEKYHTLSKMHTSRILSYIHFEAANIKLKN